MSIFNTEVTAIGAQAELFKEEEMLILFGAQAPEGLAEYCYTIRLSKTSQDIQPGQLLHFDDHAYRITAVGNVVNKNLNDLGHITIKFNGATEAELAGTLYVENRPLPAVDVGTEISISE